MLPKPFIRLCVSPQRGQADKYYTAMLRSLLYRSLSYGLLLTFFVVGTLDLSAQQLPYEGALKERAPELKHVRGNKLRAYRISLHTGQPIQDEVADSLTLGTHRYTAPESRSLGVAYAANANAPWQSKIFFDRWDLPDFIYSSGFQGRLFTPDRTLFYDTRTPFTFVHYRKNFGDDVLEEVLTGTLSTNLGRAINIGITGDYIGSAGYYSSSKSKTLNYRIFGSYRSDRYDLWTYIANDDHRQAENGGINNPDYILNPENYTSGRVRITSKDVPVNLPNDILYNRLTVGHGFLSHRYKLGTRRTIQVIDSIGGKANASMQKSSLMEVASKGVKPQREAVVRDSSFFVPVGSISHQVYYTKQRRRMVSRVQDERWLTFFGEPKANQIYDDSNTLVGVLPNDTAQQISLHNSLSLALHEGFRPWVKAGLNAYLRSEQHWISIPNTTTRAYHNAIRSYSIYAGGELARQTGKGLNFSVQGEVGVAGADLGAFTFKGEVLTKFRFIGKDFGLKADASLSNGPAPDFSVHHHGTWAWWDKDLRQIRRLELGAKADLTSWGTWAELRTASLQNQIYWLRSGEVAQYEPLMQVNMLRLGHSYRWGVLGWELEGAYQLTTNENILPLPKLTARGDLYLDFYLLGILQTQIGIEGYWHSAYHAPYYHPAIMQFVNQNEAKVGGEAPLLNAYANFRHKNTRFYVRMFNAGEILMRSKRESMYRYVYNPMHLQVGLVVDLRN